MPGSRDDVIVHSLTEASLYLVLAACPACGGPTLPSLAEATGPGEHDDRLVVPVTCRTCGQTGEVRFSLHLIDPIDTAGGLQRWTDRVHAGQVPPINPTKNASQAIDVAGWLTLYTLLSESARTQKEQPELALDKFLIRQLQIQAGQCLDEALKLYDLDNDLPPANAFFTREGREQFREHPDLFLRQRLIGLRVKLPVKHTDEGR